jgi:hypothetical protein
VVPDGGVSGIFGEGGGIASALPQLVQNPAFPEALPQKVHSMGASF